MATDSGGGPGDGDYLEVAVRSGTGARKGSVTSEFDI